MFGHYGNYGSLFDDFRRLEQELEQLFGDGGSSSALRASARGSFPALNVGATPDQVDVLVYAAGLDPQSLDISLQQNVLTIAGQRNHGHEDEQAVAYRRERYSGEFRRALALPEDVDPDRVDASYRNGVLHIRIQRRETSRPRRIEVA
jgi:HSP20 family protein